MEILFPKTCVGCQKIGKYFCDKCSEKVEIIGADYKNRKLEGRIGLFKYHGVIKDLIKLIKFDLVLDAKTEIGELITEQLKVNYPNILEYWQTKKFVIVPVPLHWRRENWRGFNQANIIANEVGKILNLNVNNNLIKRSINTKKQAMSDKVERGKNMDKAFVLDNNAKQNKVFPKNIIIFDDVWTTGNTIKNITKIIPKDRKIWVLTIASGN